MLIDKIKHFCFHFSEDSNILLPPSDSKNTVKEQQQVRDPEQARETDSSCGQNMVL